MKKKILQKLTAVFACCLMMISVLPVAAATEPEQIADGKWQVADHNYYTEANGFSGFESNPSITIKKLDPDDNEPISKVKFKTAKVGDLYQIETTTGHMMVYGLRGDFADILGIQEQAEYKFSDGTQMIYCYSDLSFLNRSGSYETSSGGILEGKRTKVMNYLTTYGKECITDTYGKASVPLDTANNYGLYVVMESDVSKAEKNSEPISITRQEIPYVVALPTNINNTWDNTVEVTTKNSTGSADLTKKIVTNYNGTGDLITDEAVLDDTDITHMTDAVEFCLTTKLPMIPDKPDSESISQMVITDRLSAGLTVSTNLQTNGDVVVKTSKGDELDSSCYTIVTNPIASEDEYNGGTQITVTFTAEGMDALTTLAKGTDQQYVSVYYKATVNEKAVVGPNGTDNMGNPNEAMLTYQVGSSPVISTDWDKVSEFVFEIDAEKKLKDTGNAVSGDNASKVQFVLYTEKENVKTYYTFKKVEDGKYKLSGTAPTITEDVKVSPSTTDGTFQLIGLDETVGDDCYYLQEIATVSGYNLLKAPIEIQLTADKGTNRYTGTENQYLGTLTEENDTDGITNLTIINTKGFQLPSTGGAGIWLCVLIGIAVVAIGVVYFAASGKKDKKRS